jgi:hydroxyacylglutathione hydrolase
MKIGENVYLIGSGTGGLMMSNALDCNVYLLDGGSDAAIIDAGGGVEPERMVAEIERDGIDLKKISTVLLTHAHGDHAAGARLWHDNYGMKVWCACESKPWIESGDEEKSSLKAAREAGIYPHDFRFPPCPIHRALDDGEEITIGDAMLTIIDTPGHSRGHISFWWESQKAIFCGDLIFPGGKIAPQVTWDFSILELRSSIEKLHALKVQSMFAGHSAPLITNGHEDIEIAHRRLQKMSFPKPLF